MKILIDEKPREVDFWSFFKIYILSYILLQAALFVLFFVYAVIFIE